MDKKKEPLFHVSKRSGVTFKQAWTIRIVAILIALLFSGIITSLLTGLNPISVYATIIKGSFGSSRKIWVMLQSVAILLLISLALTPAFKMRFWNVGGEGQILMGCLASAACLILLNEKVPSAVCIILMIITSIGAGAIWALIPAFFKAKWNTNETLATLMMNYIATQIVAYFIIVWENPKGSGAIGIINLSSEFGWLPDIVNKYLLSIIVALLVTAAIYIYLKYSKHGYEISVVGESENTAKYVGIKVDKVILRTVALSGAVCGLVGLLLVGSINHTLTTSLAGGQGFTAVMVSWLAHFNPFAMILTSFLVIFMTRGGSEIASTFALNEAFGDILTGIILFFIIGCEFFINYKITFNNRKEKE